MIRVERGPIPPGMRAFTARRSKAGRDLLPSRAERELAEAIMFYGDLANFKDGKKVFKGKGTFGGFKVYKDGELTAALEVVFNKKCAYCESRFAHVTPKDIEHFRPKSEVARATGPWQPGYYWLAGEWTNLLVSCPMCNRPNTVEVVGFDKPLTVGKGTQFPLAREASRVHDPRTKLTREERQRLLIDPCTEEPADYLVYNEKAWILPKPDDKGKPSPKGTESIRVYGLMRKELVDERLVVLNSLVFEVDQVRRAIGMYHRFRKATDKVGMEFALDQIRALKGRIGEILAERSPFLGMLRWWIRGQKHEGHLADLEPYGIDLESMWGRRLPQR